MARLPVPGGDDGTWGDVLNQFLVTQHNADGTHNLALNDLNDVNTAGAVNGHVLTYNGSSWVTQAGGGGGDPVVGGDLTGTASNAQIASGAIVDADINASANIAQSKVANLTTDLSGKLPIKNSVQALTDSTNDTFVRYNITDDGSPTGSWPDRLSFYFSGNRTGYHNEYGELRARPAKDNTVALRAMKWSGASTVDIFQVTHSSLSPVYFGVGPTDIDVTVPMISTSTITATNLLYTTDKGAANGVASLDAGIKVPIAQLPDSTTTTKGIVQLAGDLAGTAAAPTVPGLANKIDNSEKGQPNGVAQLDGSGKVTPGQLQTSNITKVLPYSYLGNLVVGAGTFRLYNDMGTSWTITGVRASVGTASAGASIIIDIHKNGTTIFTTQANRPTIAAAANTSGNVTNMDVTTVAAGEYLTVDIDQIGSTTAGADLTVQVEVV